jgi:hypothetical protein
LKTVPQGTSPKFEAFVQALRELCEQHGVMIGTSMHADLRVWDALPGEDVFPSGIEDRTNGQGESD